MTDTWSVGELAARTGLTVRTLHHYDEIGLARPSQRTAAGHRRYTAADVDRLHRVTALRGFGFTLAEIGGLLDAAGPAPRELVERQRALVDDQIARAVRQRERLDAVLRVFDTTGGPSVEVLVTLIEGQTTMTREEFEQMAAHRTAVTAQLSDEERERMAAARTAYWESLDEEQRAELIASRPPIPS